MKTEFEKAQLRSAGESPSRERVDERKRFGIFVSRKTVYGKTA